MVPTELADPPHVLGLEAVDGAVLGLVGGKAANLGELIGAGLPVPPGFCLTTGAYRMVAGGTDLRQVCAALETTSPSDAAALTGHARRAAVARRPQPPSACWRTTYGCRSTPQDAADPDSEFRRGAAEADAMIAALQNGARRRSGARAAAVGLSLRRTRQPAGLREMPKYLMVLAVAGARAELALVGQHLVSTGRVKAADGAL
jgi:Pyruvate phosphate dikinase, AMP/ATP-binding domain